MDGVARPGRDTGQARARDVSARIANHKESKNRRFTKPLTAS